MSHKQRKASRAVEQVYKTISSRGGWALLLASPFTWNLLSAQALLDTVGSQKFSDLMSLHFHKYSPVKKTEGLQSKQSRSFPCVTLGRLSRRKKNRAAAEGQRFKGPVHLDSADSVKENAGL